MTLVDAQSRPCRQALRHFETNLAINEKLVFDHVKQNINRTGDAYA
jgi:hypothetical protein